MSIQYYIFPLLLSMSLLFGGCQSDTAATPSEASGFELKRDLEGTWQTVQINVAVNSADGLDSFRVENLSEQIWRQQFGMQPPKFYFQPDNKFRRVHETLQGKVMDEGKGMWNAFGDTLVMIEPDATYQYIVKGDGGRATFRTLMDWDEDGETDDEFQALRRKISVGSK
ncbi:MAG: hypothetical protein AAGJ82_03015 [Bacteroidota bacterium]